MERKRTNDTGTNEEMAEGTNARGAEETETTAAQRMREVVRSGYDEGDYYGLYGRRNLPKKWQQALLRRFVQLLPESAAVLDWGAGNGDPYLRWLLAHGCRATAVEFSRRHLQEGLKVFPEATWIYADFSRFPWPDAAYDGLQMIYSLLHIPRQEQKALLTTAARTLKPGAALLITLTDGASDTAFEIESGWAEGPGMAFSHFDLAANLQMLREVGFEMLAQCSEKEQGGEGFTWVLAQKSGTDA